MMVNAVLRHFPRLKVWFKRLNHANSIYGYSPTEESFKHLSPHARKIYTGLKSAMARQQQKKTDGHCC